MNRTKWVAALTTAVVLVVLCIAGFSDEYLRTRDTVTVQQAHQMRVQQNVVMVLGRHCQAYAGVDGRLSAAERKRCHADPRTEFFRQANYNLRTNAGSDWQESVMGNTAAPPATCNYVAVSDEATAPAATDTVVAGEIAANGLSRAQGTYTTGTNQFKITKTFTATGTQSSRKSGLLNASSAGTLCFENTYTAVTVNNGDTLTVEWTINI